MTRGAVFHQLLLADLLLEAGVDRRALATALEKVLARREDGLDLLDLLGSDEHKAVAETATALVGEHGSAQDALQRRSGPRRLSTLALHAGPTLRRTLLEIGADVAPALRPMPADRYLDFVPVGKGGMGIVYWAIDAELNREVALKVIQPAPDGAGTDVTPISPTGLVWPPETERDRQLAGQLEARFLQEAWITGSMTHPGIVPVYELGRTEAGVPYYTMRFVEGQRTLADAIEEARTEPLAERLLLLEPFLSVCDTIRYAHSRGVLHRDLKPSNVALGEYGEVVVVDWGLARVRHHEDVTRGVFQERLDALQDAPDLRTLVSVVGTPGYLSPEAAAGSVDAIEERSDVYSLASVLFQILTTRLPIPVESVDQYLEDVRVGGVPDARTIEPDVPTALAVLCGEALATDPDERTPSVEALAEGIRTWRREAAVQRELRSLAREAETALEAARDAMGKAALPHLERAAHAGRRMQELRPEDPDATALLEEVDHVRAARVERLERSARRRLMKRVTVGIVAITAVAAVIVAVVLEQRRQEAADARASAAAAREQAEGVMTFMVGDLLDDLEPLGRLDVVTKVGARARDYYDLMPAEDASPASLRNRALALRRLGDAFGRLGNLPEALSAYRAARVSAEALERRDAASGRFNRVLAEAAIGETLFRQGHPTQARELLTTGRTALTELAETRTDDPELLAARSAVDARIARILRTEGRLDEAVSLAQEALGHAERAARLDPRDLPRRRTVLRRQLDLADVEYGPERVKRAEAMRAVIAEIEALGAASPDDVRWTELAAVSRLRLALTLHALSRFPAAAAEATRSATALETLAARDPSNLSWAAWLASTKRVLGDAYVAEERFADAQALYLASYARMLTLAASDPSNAAWLNRLITCCDRLVMVGQRLAVTPEERLGWRRDAVAHARELVARDPGNAKHRHILAYTLHQYGALVLDSGRLEDGFVLTTESARLITELLTANPESEEIAVLFGWNAQLEMRFAASRTRAIAIAAAARAVLADVVKRRPDYWLVREMQITLSLRQVELLLAADAPRHEDASEVLDAVDRSIEGAFSEPELSTYGETKFIEHRERARAARDRIESGR